MKYIICLIAACLPVLGWEPALAVPVTYIEEVFDVSGSLRGIGFSDQTLILSAAGDTNNITQIAFGNGLFVRYRQLRHRNLKFYICGWDHHKWFGPK
jgi:hypothetical protein